MVDGYRGYLCKHVFILNPIIVILTRVYPTPQASVYVFIIYHQYPLSSWQIMGWLGMEQLLFLVGSSSPAGRPWHYDIMTLILTCDIQYFVTNFHSNIPPVTSSGSVKVPVIKYKLYMRICHQQWRHTKQAPSSRVITSRDSDMLIKMVSWLWWWWWWWWWYVFSRGEGGEGGGEHTSRRADLVLSVSSSALIISWISTFFSKYHQLSI